MIRRTTSGSERVPTPATWGRWRSGANVPPPKSSTKNWVSSGVVVSAVLVTIVRSRVLLPLRGPPTTATWPLAPLRSTESVSRRCSRGRSTVPSGIDEAGDAAPPRRHQAELRVLGEVAHQLVERVGDVERRQPDLVGCRAVAGHPVDRDVEQRVLLALLRRGSRDRVGVGVGRHQGLHLGDRERQDPPHVAALVSPYPRLAAGRPGDVRRLEPQQVRRVGFEVAEPGDRRELVGVGHAEDGAGLARAERPEAHPVGQVRLQAAEPALLEPLRGEQQVQPQRAAEPADGHEEIDELRFGRQHLGELVDDDEERRHRLELLAGGPRPLVVADRGEVAGLAQQLLAAHHLAGQSVLHPVDERELLGEVRDHRGDVRQLRHARERRAALEVDEDQVELLGGVRHREPEHQRAQELRLAGPGRADHQAVRSHALLSALLDVEVDQAAALAEPDGHAQPVARGPGPPGGVRFERVDVAQPQQVHEVGRTGDLAARLGVPGRDGVERGEPSRERLRGREVALVAHRLDGVLPQPQCEHRHPAACRRRTRELRSAAGWSPRARPSGSAGRAP